MKYISHLLLIVFLLAVLFPSVSFASCTSDAQCPSNMQCDMSMGTWGVCEPRSNPVVPECTSDYDCSANTVCSYGQLETGACLNGKCTAKITYCPGGECADDKTCKSEQSVDNKCANVQCHTAICTGGILYTNGQCNPAIGRCAYTQETCPLGCDGSGTACRENKEISGQVYYKSCNVWNARNSGGKPLAVDSIKLKFDYTDASGNRHSDPGNIAWTDADGKFILSNDAMLAPGNKIDVSICFEDKDNKLFLVKQDTLADTVCLPIQSAQGVDSSAVGNLQIDLTPKPGKFWKEANSIDNYIRIYSDVQNAVRFKENVLGQKNTIKERVIVEWDGYAWASKFGKSAYLPARDSHLSEAFPDGTVGEGPTGLRVYDGYRSCYLDTPDTQFHEYCHHIQSEFSPEELLPTRLPTGENHGGYFTNNNTEWGMIEGWAEFCDSEMNKYYGTAPYGFIAVGRTSLVNLEPDYPIRGSGYIHSSQLIDYNAKKKLNVYDTKYEKDSSATEEFAIAGIMLDLVDSPSDYRGGDDDHVSIPLSELFSAFSGKRNFADGYHSPYTLSQFYTAINAVTANNAQLHSEFSPGSKYTNLDQIFIRHLGFQDENNNTIWDSNESIGYTGRLDRVRSSPPYVPGTELIFSITDQNGKIADSLSATVTVAFDAPNEPLSYTYEVPIENNSIYIPIVPESYGATIAVQAFQPGTTNKASDTFTITTKELYERIDPEVPIGIYTGDISLSEVAIPEPDPNPEPEPEPCAITFVVVPLLIFVLIRKK